MSDDPMTAPAIPFLDDELTKARDALSRAVERSDAIRDLQEIAVSLQAELRHSPTFGELINGQPSEKERARVVSLLRRANTGDLE